VNNLPKVVTQQCPSADTAYTVGHKIDVTFILMMKGKKLLVLHSVKSSMKKRIIKCPSSKSNHCHSSWPTVQKSLLHITTPLHLPLVLQFLPLFL